MSAPEEKKMKKLPKYIQIIQFIKEKIGNGEWPIEVRFQASARLPNTLR